LRPYSSTFEVGPLEMNLGLFQATVICLSILTGSHFISLAWYCEGLY
jgi:hypothetical protein